MAVLQHPLTMVSFVGANDRDILPHFLRHYRALGARSFELTIQGDWDDANRSRLESESDVQLSAHRDVPFTEELRLRDLNRMAAHHRNSWILHADVDEFLQLPAATLEETIDWLTRLRSEALPAVLVQRLSATGELPSVDDGAELDELFPSWNFGLTEDMGVRPPVWKTKFPLVFVGDHFEFKRGNHFPPNPNIAFAAPIRGVVHHYKWRGALTASIDSERTGEGNQHEQDQYARWLKENEGRLPTTNSRPALTSEFRNCGLLVSPNGFERLDHVARTILDDTARGRIVLVSFEVEGPDRNGGVGTAVGALAERLAQAGHDVHIVYCPYSEHGLHEMWVDYWEARGVSFHVVRRFDDDGRFRWFRQASTAVADLVESLAPDVAHFVDCDALGAVAAVRRSARRSLEHTRIITTTHGSVLWVSSHAGESLRDQEVAITEGFSRLLRHSDLVCHPSQYMRDWVGERFEEPSRVVVVPNCLSGMKRSFSTTDPNPRAVSEIVLFGRLDPVKGLDRFARAIRLLWDEPDCPPFSVTLMGRIVDEDMRRYIEDLFGGVPCTTSLRFLTNYDSAEAQNHLRTRPCVAVVPSVLDNLPYTVYECLDGSIPVITSSVGGIPELVHPDDRSRVLVADSAASLAEALQDALRLGGAPARLAFDPIDIDVQQINLHEQLVADARRGRRPGEFGWQTRLTIAERARSELYLLRSRQEPELVRRVRMALRHRAKRLLTYLRGLST